MIIEKSIIGSFSRYRSRLFTVNYRISAQTSGTTLTSAVKRLAWLVDRESVTASYQRSRSQGLVQEMRMRGVDHWLPSTFHTTAGHHPMALSTPMFFDLHYPHPRNDHLYIEWDVKLYSHDLHAAHLSCGR